MTINHELSEQALSAIEASLDNWNQSAWALSGPEPEKLRVTLDDIVTDPPCGTTFCYAGFVALAAGARYDVKEDHFIDENGIVIFDVQEYASRQLGVTDQSVIYRGETIAKNKAKRSLSDIFFYFPSFHADTRKHQFAMLKRRVRAVLRNLDKELSGS